MKQTIIVFFILFSFLSVATAELSSLCVEDTISHNADHEDESSPQDQKDHCHKSCGQCHFAAVVPKYFYGSSEYFIVKTSFVILQKSPRAVSMSLYRPPIA